MTTQTEALKLALELLAVGTFHSPELQAKRTEVIERGLKALAQPEQEPVAQCTNSDTWNCKYCHKTEVCEALKDHRNFGQPKVRTGNCLLTGVCASEGHKIQKALADDAVAFWPEPRDENTESPPSDYYAEGWNDCLKECWEAHRSGVRGYAPQRTWVGLTDEEVLGLLVKAFDELITEEILDISDAIEAKLKEKNNG